MMAWFRKYDKMQLGRLPTKVSGTGKFVVTEKIHGANFSVHAGLACTGVTTVSDVQFGRRGGLIEEDDNFYCFRSEGLAAELSKLVSELAMNLSTPEERVRLLGAEWKSVTIVRVSVYGELCGGRYPHPDVPGMPGLQPVQHGIWYSPHLQFVGFDVLVTSTFPTIRPENDEKKSISCTSSTYLGFEQARRVCEEVGIIFVSPLCTGTLPTCLGFSERFSSTLPSLLNLPPLDIENLAEGVVIRAMDVCRSPGPHPCRVSSGPRPMFKIKIPEFSESKKYQNKDWKSSKRGIGGSGYDPEEHAMLCEMMALITENRLNNVLSKHGRLEVSDRVGYYTVLKAYMVDVVDDLGTTLEKSLTLRGLSAHLRGELDANTRAILDAYLSNVDT